MVKSHDRMGVPRRRHHRLGHNRLHNHRLGHNRLHNHRRLVRPCLQWQRKTQPSPSLLRSLPPNRPQGTAKGDNTQTPGVRVGWGGHAPRQIIMTDEEDMSIYSINPRRVFTDGSTRALLWGIR